jgi:hypothetical protein
MPNEGKSSWKEKLLEELKKLSLTVAYLLILFSVFTLYKMIVLSQYHINFTQKFGFNFLNALILAKFVLIADAFHAGKRSDSKPFLFSILIKSAVFSVILMACHIVEETAVRMFHGEGFIQSLPAIDGVIMREFLAASLIMFVVLIPFFAMRELIRMFGKDGFKALVFSRGASAVMSTSKP